jgi:hypothetical protein
MGKKLLRGIVLYGGDSVVALARDIYAVPLSVLS